MSEDIGKQIDELIETAVDYGKTTLELTKLKAVDKVSDVAASVISKLAASVVLLLFILFVSLGLAFWLGEVLGKVYLGFLVVGGFYLLLVLLVQVFLTKWIKKVTCNYLIKRILS
jgi:hypothetical protein